MYQNDIITSLSYFLMKNVDDAKSTSERREDGDKRPYFRIENAKHQTVQMGSKGFLDNHAWYIWYFGKGEESSRNIADFISKKANTDRKIQGYLFNFVFPEGEYLSKEDFTYKDSNNNDVDASIDVAELFVSITGLVETVDSDGSILNVESLPSPIKSIDMTGANALRIYFPKIPMFRTGFDYYNIYAGTDEDNLILQNSDPITHSIEGGIINRYATKRVDLVSLITAGSNPPEELGIDEIAVNRLIPFYQIYVMETRVEHMEDEAKNGLWDSKIELITHTRGELANSKPYPAIDKVDIRGFVDGKMVLGKSYPDSVSTPKVPVC